MGEKRYLSSFCTDKNKFGIVLIRELSSEEYKNFLKSQKIGDEISKRLLIYNMVKDNYQDMEKYFEFLKEEFKKDQLINYPNMQIIYEFNRLFSNYLSSISLLQWQFKKLIGIDSEDKKLIKSLNQKSKELFEEHISYRFISKLRNFYQHTDEPLVKFYFTGNPQKPFILYLNKDYLLNHKNASWNQYLIEDINSLNKEIEVMENIIEMNECLTILRDFIVNEEIKLYKKDLKFLLKLREEVPNSKGIPIISNNSRFFDNFPLVLLDFIQNNDLFKLLED